MPSRGKSRNRGEISELYVLARLLSDDYSKSFFDGKSAADFSIHKVIVRRREEDHKFLIFGPEVAVMSPGRDSLNIEVLPRVDRHELGLLATGILSEIQSARGGSTARSMPAVRAVLQRLGLPDVSGGSHGKGDIGVDYFDTSIGRHLERWFSIKSRVGAPPSFINAGANRVTYAVRGINALGDVSKLNSMDAQESVAWVLDHGGKFELLSMQQQFRENLLIIDSALDTLVATCLLTSYARGSRAVNDVVERVASQNPLGFPQSIAGMAYKHKFLNFLQDSALGMVPSKPWTGASTITGGCIEVAKNGALVIYQPDQPADLREYLWCQTKFDTPSRPKTGSGVFRFEDGEIVFDLKVLIRYK